MGNISMGGTGKTPTVIFLAKHLARNHRVCVLSRGYKGKLSSCGAVVSNGLKTLCSPEESGDEAFLMASQLPGVIVAIGKNRLKMAHRLTQKHEIDVILLDDGFQHYNIHRDTDIVLLDSQDPFCEKKGILREAPHGLARADVIIFSRAEGLSDSQKKDLKELIRPHIVNPKISSDIPTKEKQILFSAHVPEKLYQMDITGKNGEGRKARSQIRSIPLKQLKGKNIFALSGIANPVSFETSLLDMGASEIISLRFRDHHLYSPPDVHKILSSFARAQEDTTRDILFVTTEKDWVKLIQFNEIISLKNFFYLKIELKIEDFTLARLSSMLKLQ